MKRINFDPRAKFILFLIACLFCMNVQNDFIILIFGTFIATLLILSGYVKSTIKIYIVFCIGSVIDYISKHIEPNLFSTLLAILSVSICLAVPIVLSFILVFRTTKISEFLSAFQQIKVPAQVSIPFVVMFRFIPTVSEEWRGIRQAMAFRGIGLTTGKLIFHPIMTAEHILVPLLSSCVSIIDELVAASLVRGLDSEKERNCYLTIKMKYYDYILMFFNVVFIAIMIFL